MSGQPAKLSGPGPDLARNRTQLALERTTLAWIRTTLTMASFGFGMVAFFSFASKTRGDLREHEAASGGDTDGRCAHLAGNIGDGAGGFVSLIRAGEASALSHWPLSITVAMLFAVIS